MKQKEHDSAIELRKLGKSVREIAKTLGVSKGSVSSWVKDVRLTDIQVEVLNSCRGKYLGVAHKVFVENSRINRLNYQQEGRQKARENESDHKAMCMLFWAEGSKTKNSCILTNSDVRMMVYFVSLLKKFFVLQNENFTVNIKVHIDNGISLEDIENWWLDKLQLPKSCLRKASVDHRVVSGKKGRKNRLHYGVCSVHVNETRVVQHIFGAIQEYVGFEEETWLNKI